MLLPTDWEKIPDSKKELKLGGHICKIINAYEYENPKNGNISIKIEFDIDENSEFDGYMADLNNSLNRWPNEGCKYFSIKKENLPFLKNFIKILKKSNKDVEIHDLAGEYFDLNQLIGLKIGGEFGLNEYMDINKDIKTSISLLTFKDIESLPYIGKPRVKKIDGSYTYYDNYYQQEEQQEYQQEEISTENETFDTNIYDDESGDF